VSEERERENVVYTDAQTDRRTDREREERKRCREGRAGGERERDGADFC
jgi:hypothetical protein